MKKNRPGIRNFCIIAHIDHGKSTLSDRLIERSLLLADRDKREQILDDMDIERERGITIKSHAITIPYESADGATYFLNFVDTPGHVDFSYEVSRAISSCEGALLLIDATQGPQAQTVSNMYMALEHDLEIIPVINKIDLPSARVEDVKHQIEHELGLLGDDAVLVSAKTGEGIDALLEKIIELVPPPKGESDKPLQALIFDSHYDIYRGVIIHVRVFDGEVKAGDELKFMSNKAVYKAEEVGIFVLALKKQEKLSAGDVGYIISGIKTVSDINIGDTITAVQHPCEKPLEGFRLVKPVVFSSIYPVDANDYEELQSALEKLKLNDSSLVYEKDSSAALGFGYRCGFLGLLHLEVVQERLEREYGLSLVLTAPSVKYRITLNKGQQVEIDNPLEFPDPGAIAYAEEPYIKAMVITPDEFLGNVINLCMEKRGVQQNLTYLDEKRVELVYDMPLAEVLFDFYDRLKSTSKGYASFDYEVIGYKESSLVKLDILVNGESVDALSQLVFRDNAYEHARRICRKLKEEIPRHQFKIAIQGSIGSSIIARETVSPLRKDVTAKCYGGDISRKRKLIEKQKEGKKRMKMVGNVELPQSAFLSVLKSEDS
jgi:GTP-binding protein LepA